MTNLGVVLCSIVANEHLSHGENETRRKINAGHVTIDITEYVVKHCRRK